MGLPVDAEARRHKGWWVGGRDHLAVEYTGNIERHFDRMNRIYWMEGRKVDGVGRRMVIRGRADGEGERLVVGVGSAGMGGGGEMAGEGCEGSFLSGACNRLLYFSVVFGVPFLAGGGAVEGAAAGNDEKSMVSEGLKSELVERKRRCREATTVDSGRFRCFPVMKIFLRGAAKGGRGRRGRGVAIFTMGGLTIPSNGISRIALCRPLWCAVQTQ